MVEALAQSLWEKVPGYETTSLDRSELIDTIRASVRVLLTCIAEGRAPNDSELQPARTLGERRAAQGVPIESVVGSWHNAERFFLQRLLATGEPLLAGDIREAGRRVAHVIDAMTATSTGAYREISSEMQAQFSQAGVDIVSRLAGAAPLEPGDIERRARLIGVEAHLPHRVIALGTQQGDPLTLTKARRLLTESLRPHNVGRMLAGSHQGFLLLVLADRADVVAVIQRAMRGGALLNDVVAGLGQPRPRLGEAAGSVGEAISALQVALILGRRVVSYEHVIPEVLLLENPLAARAMAHAVLGPVNHPDLVATLRTFLESGLSIRATARALHIHENTVSYRVKRIVESLHADSATSLVRPDILLALRALDLEGKQD